MKKADLKRHNGRIEKIGYYFCGHYQVGGVRVMFENSGGTCMFDLVGLKTIRKFVGMFTKSVDFENGFYIEELKGQAFCGWFDNDRIVGFSEFLDDDGHNITMLTEDTP